MSGYHSIHEFASLKVASSKRQVSNVGTSITLTSDNSGNLLLLNSTSGSAITLPGATGNAGLTFEILVAATSAGHVITGAASSLVGCIPSSVTTLGSSITTNGAATLSTTTGSAVGDTIKLVSTGTKWAVSGAVKNFNGAVFA